MKSFYQYLFENNLTNSKIKGLEGYSEDEIKDLCSGFIEDKISDFDLDINIVELFIHGSRKRGNNRADSDLDIVLFYSGTEREDDLFNILNEDPFHIEDIKVDINPIRASSKSAIEAYKKKSSDYDSQFKI